MRYDRDGYDRLGFYDRAGYTDPFSLGLNGTGSFTVKVDRTIPLEIAATGEYSDELVNRAIPLSIEATGAFDSLLVDYAKVLAFGATGAESLLLDRSLQLAFEGSGVFDYTYFRRIMDLLFGAVGSFTVDPFLRGLYAAWGATGAYPIECDDPTFSSIMAFDRGRYDRGTLSTNCQIYPVRVDRTIPLTIAATGLFSNPIFDWYLQCSWGATGAETDPLVNRTIPLSIAATGVFADITPFIPVHYLSANWGSTGTFVFGYTWVFDVSWGATGNLTQTNPYIPIHYLSAAWGATGAFIDPRVWRAIVNINNLLISGKISRSLADKMYSAVFQFDKTTTPDSLYWSKVIFKMPDYTGTAFNTVFVGIIPSGDTQFNNVRYLYTATGKQQFKGYDYGWYLSAQTVEPENQVLLTWTDQQAAYNHLYQLNYHNGTKLFTPGDRVRGNYASTDSATVISVVGTVVGGYLILSAMIGSVPYFQDNEPLSVNYVDYALANGSATDLTPSPPRVWPDDYIRKLLGGDTTATKWAEVTGIYPKYFESTASVWGSTIPEIEFAFTQTTTKIQAIEKICNYMNWIFYVRWDTAGSAVDTPSAYFLPREDLDLVAGQPLPAPVYVTSTFDFNSADARKHLKSSFRLVQSGENQYNWYTVRCQGLQGEWHEAYDYDGDPYDPTFNPTGTEIKRPYVEINQNITTYAECVQRVTDLMDYYSQQVQTWTATFRLRSDFALLQKLIISGYNQSIPDGDYRIISIEYNFDKAGTINEVTVQIIPDNKFQAYLNLKRVFYDPIFEIQNIAQKVYNDNTVNMKGTVIVGNTLPSQVIKVSLTGVYGTVTRTAYSTTVLTAGDSVTLTQDQTSGRLMAVKA